MPSSDRRAIEITAEFARVPVAPIILNWTVAATGRSGLLALLLLRVVPGISTPPPPPFFNFQNLDLTPSANLLCGVSDRVDIHIGERTAAQRPMRGREPTNRTRITNGFELESPERWEASQRAANSRSNRAGC